MCPWDKDAPQIQLDAELTFDTLTVTLTLNFGESKYPGAQVSMLTSI